MFDISQTDGPALPPTTPALLNGPAPLVVWADLLTQVESAGYRVGEADLAPANGLTDFTDHTVTVHRGLAPAQKTKTLAHELAHVRLHAPRVRPPGMDRAVAEIEAESVAYIVTAAHGITSDAYSVPYVTGWARGDSTRVASTATRVLSCARAVLRHTDPTTAANSVLSVVRDRDRPAAPTPARLVDPAVRAVDR